MEEYFEGFNVPLAFLEAKTAAGVDLFEELPDDVAPQSGSVVLGGALDRLIRNYETAAGHVREVRYVEDAREPQIPKLAGKLKKTRHLLRRLGAHPNGRETTISVRVARALMSSIAVHGADVMLATNGVEDLEKEFSWAYKTILGVRSSASSLLASLELGGPPKSSCASKRTFVFSIS